MKSRWRCLPVVILLTAAACLSTGPKIIAHPDTFSLIQADKSTEKDVRDVLGLPFKTLLLEDGGYQWQYWYVCETPWPSVFVPVVDAFLVTIHEKIRILTITFDKTGLVRKLEWREFSESLG